MFTNPDNDNGTVVQLLHWSLGLDTVSPFTIGSHKNTGN